MLSELIHQKNCKKNIIVTYYHTEEIACGNCGSVLSEKSLDSRPEISMVKEGVYHNHNRVSAKISLKMVDIRLSTIIESKDKDSTGKIISNENRKMFYHLRMWDRNSRSAYYVNSFQKAFTLLDGISSKLGLLEFVVEYTTYLFRKISAKKILTGRSVVATLCATAYIACRLTNTPRTLHDVAEAGNIKKKNLQRTYRFLVMELQIYPESYSPIEFVTRITKAIRISEKTERLTFKILDAAMKNNISASKNPVAMAATAIHLATIVNKEKIAQIKISKVSGISAVTIRDRVNEIREIIGGEING